MNRRSALLGAVSLLGAFVPVRAAQRSNQGRASVALPVKVMVVDSQTHEPLPKARVFVLSESGAQLAEAWSDDLGLAALPNIGNDRRPKYLLVERPFAFIMGREWLAGQREYYMPMVVLTPPGFGG
jgi:hypothetical protein